jgi:hypothetical protein
MEMDTFNAVGKVDIDNTMADVEIIEIQNN